jgi:hypothetical protein
MIELPIDAFDDDNSFSNVLGVRDDLLVSRCDVDV